MYIISYDLRIGATPDDYDRIARALEALGARRVLLSDWALRTTYTAVQLRNHFQTFMDANDRLVVVLVADWAAFNPITDMNTI